MSKVGCYDTCNISGNCCSNFDKINTPVLNQMEIFEIVKRTCRNDFYDSIDDDLFLLKTKDNHCVFYEDGKCSIYDCRPIDCKLFPFDIIKKDINYYLVLYSLDCMNSEKLIDEADNIDELIDFVKPWIDEFTDDMNYTKMKKLKYKVIKQII